MVLKVEEKHAIGILNVGLYSAKGALVVKAREEMDVGTILIALEY